MASPRSTGENSGRPAGKLLELVTPESHMGNPRKSRNGVVQLGTSSWVNYNELTASSLEIIVSTSKGNHPQMALIQVSELL